MFKRVITLVLILLIILIVKAFLFPYPTRDVPLGPKPQYGFSYSFENASWYGLDSREAYIKLLECCNFKWVRVPFYWDKSDLQGLGNIEDLKFAVREAEGRNINVVVALGLKTPYYPEFHLPSEIATKIPYGDRVDVNDPVAKEVLAIDRKVVEELSAFKNISHWQIENEPFLANINNWQVDISLVKAEVDVVRSADPLKRPIILTHVGPSVFDKEWKSLIPLLENGDVLGVNAYFKTQGVNLLGFSLLNKRVEIPWPNGLVWPVQSWTFFSPDFAGLKKDLEKSGLELWIMEMQADPYIRTLADARKSEYYFDAQDVKKANSFIRQTGVRSVGLWGAPFWVYREQIGDKSWLETVKSIAN